MIDFFGYTIAKFLLWLRYDIKISGLEEISAKGKKGILFLPNHPAFIDPIILFSQLRRKFAPKGFGDQDQVDRFIIRFFAKRWGVRTIPSVAKYGPAAKEQIEKIMDETIEGLKTGDNLLLWPAGHLYHSRFESLGANSAVEQIIKKFPSLGMSSLRIMLK